MDDASIMNEAFADERAAVDSAHDNMSHNFRRLVECERTFGKGSPEEIEASKLFWDSYDYWSKTRASVIRDTREVLRDAMR